MGIKDSDNKDLDYTSVFISCIGSNDPWGGREVIKSGEKDNTGPLMRAWQHVRSAHAIIFSTPQLDEQPSDRHSISDRTLMCVELLENKGVKVDFHIKSIDPTDYEQLFAFIKPSLRDSISKLPQLPNVEPDDVKEYVFSIGISSGTPQMQASWFALVSSGYINATLLQSLDPEHVLPGRPLVREVNLGDVEIAETLLREKPLKDIEPTQNPPIPNPLISAIYIGNFKAFKEIQRIPLAPITLLFGPNSGGKSSIIQALLYMQTVLDSNAFNVHRPIKGLDSIDLGGFRHFVHSQDENNEVELGFEIRRPYDFFPNGFFPLDELWEEDNPYTFEKSCALRESKKSKIVKRWSISSHIGLKNSFYPKLLKTSLFADNEPVLYMRRTKDKELCDSHRKDVKEMGKRYENELDYCYSFLNELTNLSYDVMPYGLLPNLYYATDTKNIPEYLIRALNEHYFHYEFSLSWVEDHFAIASVIEDIRMITAIALDKLHYIGPSRSLPERISDKRIYVTQYPQSSETDIWRALIENGDIRERISKWLSTSERVKSPYTLDIAITASENVLRHFIQNSTSDLIEYCRLHPDTEKELFLIDQKTGARLHLRDVGYGISQILPVLSAVYGLEDKTIMIEQPELHLHPALQAEIGDIFIESVHRYKNAFILETHSEHLLLRLLRRIRETTEGKLMDKPDLVLTPDMLSVVYIDPDQQAGASIAYPIPVNDNGDLAGEWPDGFFEERMKELW